MVAAISAISSTSGNIAPEIADRTSAVVATWTGFGPGDVARVVGFADAEALFPELG